MWGGNDDGMGLSARNTRIGASIQTRHHLQGRRVERLGLPLQVLAAGPEARAQSPFYAGKTVTIVVGASAGGGYDIYARAIAPFLGQHLAGNPKVVVQNMPGGGGLTSVKYLDANAPKDGTVITLFNAGVITEALTNIAKAKVDLKTMAWIGSANRSFRICYFWHGSGIRDMGRSRSGQGADPGRDQASTAPHTMTSPY